MKAIRFIYVHGPNDEEGTDHDKWHYTNAVIVPRTFNRRVYSLSPYNHESYLLIHYFNVNINIIDNVIPLS